MAQPILIEAADDHPSTTPGASGQKVSEQRYKPYGEVRWSSGAGMPTDFTFTGQRAGPANYVGSLMDYVARAYSPALGRFVSADTIVPGAGNPQAFNRYMYVRGSPLGRIDPSGHDDDRPEDFFFNLVGGFLGGLAEANGATTFSGFERSLDVQSRDSTVHDVGRFAGNVAGVYQGLVEIAGGISGGAAGALLGCGTTVCLASPAAVALGGTITLHGAAVAGAGMQFAAKRVASKASSRGSGSSRIAPEDPRLNDDEIAGYSDKFVPDRPGGTNRFEPQNQFSSIHEAREFARAKLGKEFVRVEEFKWRSQDGRWQYRAKQIDVLKGHLHLEYLDPITGQVLENYHLGFPAP